MKHPQFTGSNTDEHSNREKIWLLARRYNQQSIIKMAQLHVVAIE